MKAFDGLGVWPGHDEIALHVPHGERDHLLPRQQHVERTAARQNAGSVGPSVLGTAYIRHPEP
jgi:hypothetical protein